MARGEQVKSTRVNRDWTKARKLTVPISLKCLMGKEVQFSLEGVSIRILDHPKNLIEVLRARLPIAQGLNRNNITTGPNQYRFTQAFLDGEALYILDLKSTELRHKTAANLIKVMNHVVAHFGLER